MAQLVPPSAAQAEVDERLPSSTVAPPQPLAKKSEATNVKGPLHEFMFSL